MSHAFPFASLLESITAELHDLPEDRQARIGAKLKQLQLCYDELLHDTQVSREALAASEARYQELAESITDPFTAYDEQLRLVYKNKAAEQATLVPLEQAQGKSFDALYPNLINSEVHQLYLRALKTRQPQNYLTHWTRPQDGRTFYYDLSIYPTHHGVVAFSRDVTGRIEAEQQAFADRERFRITLSSIGDAVVTTDAQGLVTFLNPVAEQMTGWRMAEAVGMPFDQVLCLANEQSLTPIDHPVTRVLQSGTIVGLANHTVLVARNGQVIPIEDSAAPIKNQAGQVQGVVMVFHDVTEIRRAQNILRESEERYRLLFENMVEAFFILDPVFDDQGNPVDYRFVDANPSAERFLGRPRAEFLGQTSTEVFGQVDPISAKRAARVAAGKAEHVQRYSERVGRWHESFEYPNHLGQTVILSFDITERKQAEEALQKNAEALKRSEEKFAKAFRSSAAVMSISRVSNGAFIDINESFERVTGYTREEIIDHTSLELGLFTDADHREKLIYPIREQKSVRDYELKTRTKSGDIITVLVSLEPIELDGQPCVLMTGVDITGRKQAEAMVKANAESLEKAHNDLVTEHNRLLAVMEALPVGVAIIDENGGNVHSNHAFEEVWGGPRPVTRTVDDYAAYQAWWLETGQPVQPEEWASAQAVTKGVSVIGQQMEIQRFDGSRRYIINSGAPIRDAKGQVTGCAVAIMDITRQLQMEREHQEHRIKMEIQRQLLEYRDQERQALARDLHDGPVQDISSLLFNVQFAKEAITDLPMRLELDKIAAQLKTTVQNLREMVNEMRPPSLIRFGLAKAMQISLESFREKHPEIELNISLMDDGGCLSEQARLSLYRILQEALTNVVKHSRASRITVLLECEDHQVVLDIRDEGQGFAVAGSLVDYSLAGHYGLVGMKERAEAIGGMFEVKTRPEQGTTIRVVVPLNGSGGQ